MPNIDFAVYDGGSVVLVKPVSVEGYGWAKEWVDSEWLFGASVPVERRYVHELCQGILADGLTIAKDGHFVIDQDGLLILGAPVGSESQS